MCEKFRFPREISSEMEEIFGPVEQGIVQFL